MVFDQVRETKTISSQMLQPCELYKSLEIHYYLRLLFYLQEKHFNPRIKFVAEPKKTLNYLTEKVIFQNRFSINDVLYNLYSTLKV